jgi:hypothetical protein
MCSSLRSFCPFSIGRAQLAEESTTTESLQHAVRHAVDDPFTDLVDGPTVASVMLVASKAADPKQTLIKWHSAVSN